jgi:hypothetical protein
MQKLLISLSAFVVAASFAVAGPMMSDGKSSKSFKQPMVDTPAPCIDGGEFVLGLFGAYAWTDGGSENGEESSYQDDWGAGAELIYYFTQNLGLGASYTFLGDAPVHLITGDVYYRFVMDCFAPYIMGSVGGAVDSQNVFVAGGGVGLEYRVTPSVGLFTDGRYLYADEIDEIVIVRAGVRFVF